MRRMGGDRDGGEGSDESRIILNALESAFRYNLSSMKSDGEEEHVLNALRLSSKLSESGSADRQPAARTRTESEWPSWTRTSQPAHLSRWHRSVN